MKEELPDTYNKAPTKPEDNKTDSNEPKDSNGDSSEQIDTKAAPEKMPTDAGISAPPSEGNIATAAAAALASAAVKAKVSMALVEA